jgi:site-specific recombinase XerD
MRIGVCADLSFDYFCATGASVVPSTPLPQDSFLLARPHRKEALVRQLREYLYQVSHAVGLSTRILPHQRRHTYATEMLRAGMSLPALTSYWATQTQ